MFSFVFVWRGNVWIFFRFNRIRLSIDFRLTTITNDCNQRGFITLFVLQPAPSNTPDVTVTSTCSFNAAHRQLLTLLSGSGSTKSTLLPSQLNHSPRPRPPVTVCQEAFPRAPPPPPPVTTTVRMQRPPTWRRQPSSTCPPAAGRDPRPSAPSPGTLVPRCFSSDRVQFSSSLVHLHCYWLCFWTCRRRTLKWTRTAPWTSAWRRPRGRACSLQSLRPPRLHPLNTSGPPCLRATLSQSGRGRWTSPNLVESKRRTMKRYWHPRVITHCLSYLQAPDEFTFL